MKSLETDDNLIENAPHIFFLHKLRVFLKLSDFGLEVSSVSEFHNNAECLGGLLVESLLVGYHVRMLNGCEDPHFVQCILLFFSLKLAEANLSIKC
jgi:hypothetical protein